MRIVSLLPSATEIVADLGMDDLLVGRSAECDWPPHVCALPVVTAARVDTEQLRSAEIERGVDEGSLAIDDNPRRLAESLYQLWLGASVMVKIVRNGAPFDSAMALTRQLLHLPA